MRTKARSDIVPQSPPMDRCGSSSAARMRTGAGYGSETYELNYI